MIFLVLYFAVGRNLTKDTS